MTPGQLREALEAWRVGDNATLLRVMHEAQLERHRQEAYANDTADAFAYGIGPAFTFIKEQREGKAARQEFDVELIRKPDGSYSL